MDLPFFLLPYIVGATPGGFAALAAKLAAYGLFQRPLGRRSVIVLLLAFLLHFLSSLVGIAVGVVLFGWRNPIVLVPFLYAATVSVVVELACLFPLRGKLGLKRIGITVVVANAVYYLSLLIGLAVFSNLEILKPPPEPPPTQRQKTDGRKATLPAPNSFPAKPGSQGSRSRGSQPE